jgi:hypothetical protein
LNRSFGRLETDAALASIAEWLCDQASATAEREPSLAREIVAVSVSINELDRSGGSFYAIRAIPSDSCFHLSHFMFSDRRFISLIVH